MAWAVLPRWRSVLPAVLQRPVLALLATRPMILTERFIHRTAGGYERWRMLHRTTGVFLAMGFAHGLLDGTAFDDSPVLRWPYTVVGGIGLAFYVYRELLARHFSALHDYQVSEVREIAPGLTEITMVPLGRNLNFKPGQFAMFAIEAKDGWHRHPFTIASAPSESAVRITVKALGDWTGGIHELLRPGMPAVLGGPHGRFNHQKGGARQVWIAGGVGVTPFLSWLRGLAEHPVRGKVDFYYAASESPVPYADEITDLTDRPPTGAVAGRGHGRVRQAHRHAGPGRRRRAGRTGVGLPLRARGHGLGPQQPAAQRRRAVSEHPPRVLRLALILRSDRSRRRPRTCRRWRGPRPTTRARCS